jgi:two-component system sensor kinase FixL
VTQIWQLGALFLAVGVIALLTYFLFRRRLAATSVEAAEASRRFEATFEQAAVGIAHLDTEGRWLRLNKRFCEIAGHDCAQLLQKPFQIITHPDDIPLDVALTETLLSGRMDHASIEKRYLGADGRVIWINETRSLVRDADGRPDFFISIIEDIGSHKEAEAQVVTGEAQYRAIFDSAVEAMVVIDADGTIQSLNPAVTRLFLYPPAALIGQNIKMLMPETTGSHLNSYRGYQDTGQRSIIGIGREVVGRRGDGSVFPLDLSVTEWRRGSETFFTAVIRDASVRKDAEAALRASEEQLRLLQNEFAHLARVNDLGEMAAAISHEINQPLTAIVNYLNTALFIAVDGYSEDGSAETEQMVRLASAQALRAGDIVRRLREFVGQGNGARTTERVERLVDSAMALALLDASSRGVAIDREAKVGDATVEVDVVQIQQVLVNLLRNAIDALAGLPMERGPRLTISTGLNPDGAVEFVVADNGPGVAPELVERLFEPFVTTKANGMGMGLSVCRRLIEAHGGTIEAESVRGAGARFSFRLPQS